MFCRCLRAYRCRRMDWTFRACCRQSRRTTASQRVRHRASCLPLGLAVSADFLAEDVRTYHVGVEASHRQSFAYVPFVACLSLLRHSRTTHLLLFVLHPSSYVLTLNVHATHAIHASHLGRSAFSLIGARPCFTGVFSMIAECLIALRTGWPVGSDQTPVSSWISGD